MKRIYTSSMVLLAVLLMTACGTTIKGNVKLVDRNSQPIAGDSPVGITVNMINTSASLENASHSVTTNEKGEFKSEKGKIIPGMYKVEVSRIGYKTATQTIEIKKNKTKKLDLFLRKIKEGKRRSVRTSSQKKETKIINPGEVNIQPPSM